MKGLQLLSLQHAWSQLRTAEWRALLLATLIAIALSSLLTLLGDRLERGLVQESAALLGADLILRDRQEIDPARIDAALERGLAVTQVVQFPSMLHVEDNMMLVSVRAASAGYPLRGTIVTSNQLDQAMPNPGEVWLEPRIMSQLGVEIGDSASVGYADLVITAEVLSSPDRGRGFTSLSPQIIMHAEDLEKAGVLTVGSRAQYRLLVAGERGQVQAYETAIKSTLKDSERVQSLVDEEPVDGAALGTALNYLKLTALIALLLAILTIYLSLRRFSAGQFKRCALLLSLGMQRINLIKLYAFQLFSACIVLSILGTLIGVGLEQIILSRLEDILPQLPDPSWWLYFSGAAMGFALLLLLGIPPIMQLSRVQISALFREESYAADTSATLLQLACFALLAGVILAFLGAPVAAVTLLAMLLVGGVVFGWLAQIMLKLLAQPLAKRLMLGRLLAIRLTQQKRWHRLQAGVVILLLTLLSLVWFSRNDLLSDWQAQLPEDAPNYFVVNIQPWDAEPLSTFFTNQNIDSVLYPMIRGRFTHLNGAPVEETLTQKQLEHNSLNRQLNLTWSETLPEHNSLLAGQWWNDNEAAALISIEQEMAEEVGLKLGDTLGFDLAGLFIEAEISSIRQVEWASFQPNFYIIFNEKAINNVPLTYLTSFHLPDDNTQVATQMIREFPALTLVDIGQVMEEAAKWLQRIGDSSALILLLTLACGALLMILTLHQALEQRRYEGALLQTLGATARQTQQLDLMELVTLGAVCGFLALFTAEITLALMYQFLLDIPPTLHPWMWVSLPLASTGFFLISGLTMRRTLSIQQCYRLLRTA